MIKLMINGNKMKKLTLSIIMLVILISYIGIYLSIPSYATLINIRFFVPSSTQITYIGKGEYSVYTNNRKGVTITNGDESFKVEGVSKIKFHNKLYNVRVIEND